MTLEKETLLYLVRLGLGNSSDCQLDLDSVDWKALCKSANKQGLSSIVFDGLQVLYESLEGRELSLDKPEYTELKRKWFGFCVSVEKKYKSYLESLERLAEFYQVNNVPMMLLKGYGLSLNYPAPSHRQPGDIDIYLWDNWQKADRLVTEKLGISVDNSHHHHSVFQFENYMVENHYDFVNVHSHNSNKKVEEIFKNLAEDKSRAVEHILPNGAKIYFPSPDLNALFVLRHCACHFAAEAMNLRQLLDWALFVDKHHSEVDWKLFWSESEKMGMVLFVLCVNAIAVEQLGFDAEIFNTPKKYAGFVEGNRVLVNRVLEDILQPKSYDAKGKNVISYIWIRLKCWWHNRWKHKIVYNDSLFSTFFVQLKSHIMKPASIIGK